jgi:hypothetical protein
VTTTGSAGTAVAGSAGACVGSTTTVTTTGSGATACSVGAAAGAPQADKTIASTRIAIFFIFYVSFLNN